MSHDPFQPETHQQLIVEREKHMAMTCAKVIIEFHEFGEVSTNPQDHPGPSTNPKDHPNLPVPLSEHVNGNQRDDPHTLKRLEILEDLKK